MPTQLDVRYKLWHRCIITARCYAQRGIATVCCLTICLSVTLRYDFHTGWNSSKITLRPNSLRPWLWDTQHGPPGATGTPQKLELNRCGVTQQDKNLQSPKRFEIETRLYRAHRAVTFAIAWLSCVLVRERQL